MTNPSPPVTSRALGDKEWLLNFLSLSGGMIATQVLHLDRRIAGADLRAALDWLQARHPVLRAHVRLGELVLKREFPFVFRRPYFETKGTGPIPLDEVSGDWQVVMDAEIRKPLKGGKRPRFRFILVHDPDGERSRIVTTADHATVDAKSLTLLSNELLEYLAAPAEVADRPAVHAGLPPAIESRLPPKFDGTGKDRAARAKAYVPAIRIPKSVSGTVFRTTTKALPFRLPAGETDALKRAVKANRTTLSGAMVAAFFDTFRRKYGLEEMTCGSSVDLRRFASPPIPDDAIGCYIDIMRTKHRIQEDVWATAREVSFGLIAAMARNPGNASILKMMDWNTYKIEGRKTWDHGMRIDGLGSTTAGESGLGDDYGGLRLEAVSMAVALHAFGPGVTFLSFERAGALEISVCYSNRALNDEDAIDIAERSIATLRKMAEAGADASVSDVTVVGNDKPDARKATAAGSQSANIRLS